MGYNLVTATLLLSFGRLSDMYGRVKLYNIGFAIFTLGSILLFLTPSTGDAGAIEIIVSDLSRQLVLHLLSPTARQSSLMHSQKKNEAKHWD